MINWGECYLNHYFNLLGKEHHGEVFRQGDHRPSIQVIAFDNAVEGCRTFCSLGLTHYHTQIDLIAEVYVPVDKGWDVVDYLVALSLFELVGRQIPLRAGVAVDFSTAMPTLTEKFGKTSLFFTQIYDGPDGLGEVKCGKEKGYLLLGAFISRAEHQYLLHHGVDALHELFEKMLVDPYDLSRASSL